MMQLVTQTLLDQYLEDDVIDDTLDAITQEGDEALTCQRWLRQTAAKRFIYDQLYGDLLRDGPRRRVLDVGGGLMAFTRDLARRHDYTLLDLLAHDPAAAADKMVADVARPFIERGEWYSQNSAESYDIVIANDLFPNVDQRLELFLERYLPRAGSIRLSLTFYNQPRFYLARRVDADELLCLLAWNGRTTRAALEPFLEPEHRHGLALFDMDNQSVYANGRQVCLLDIPGTRGQFAKLAGNRLRA